MTRKRPKECFKVKSSNIYNIFALTVFEWFFKRIGATVIKMGNSHITRAISSRALTHSFLLHTVTTDWLNPINGRSYFATFQFCGTFVWPLCGDSRELH